MEEDAEYKEYQEEENKLIFNKIKDILEAQIPLEESKTLRGNTDVIRSHTFSRRGQEPYIDIGITYNKAVVENRTEFFAEIPEDFEFPSCYFRDVRGDEVTQLITSPYGVVTSFFLGSDNRVYMCTNVYCFDEKGRGDNMSQ